MKIFFGGAEVPGWRSLLHEERVPAVSLSFVGLARRVKHLDQWSLAEKFPADPGFRQEVMLDSGAYSVNRAHLDPSSDGYSDEEVRELYNAYLLFLTANLDRVDVFSEFDALQLGGPDREQHRAELHFLAPDKFMPIWHEADGTDELERLADEYPRVGILQLDDDTAKDISPLLRRLADKTLLHGVAMTKMRSMQALPWDSVGSTSWLSPGQYGDTFVWTGSELKRYPVKYRERARKQWRGLMNDNGFDAEAIARDATDQGTPEDRREVLRLSVWSWGKFVDSINREPAEDEDKPRGRGRPRSGAAVTAPRKKSLLPVLSLTETVSDDESGGMTEVRVGSSSANLMRCNTCFAKDKCPAYEVDSECAFEIPMVINTSEQLRALQRWAVGEQGKRVAVMRMFEMLEGGYADANLSAEMTRLSKMIKDLQDAERNPVQQEAPQVQVNFMADMFGPQVAARADALPEPIDPKPMIERVFDAEVIDGS